MAQQFTAESGFLGTITINGTEVPCTNWAFVYATEKALAANSMSGFFKIGLPTFLRASGSFRLDRNYSSGQSPYLAPISLVPQKFLAAMKLFEDQSAEGNLDGRFWGFGNVLIDSVSPTVNQAGNATNSLTVAWSVSGPTGTVTLPAT